MPVDWAVKTESIKLNPKMKTMKKLLFTIGMACVGLSAFAQGEVIFNAVGGGGYVWNSNSARAGTGGSSNYNTALVFTTSSSAVPLVASVMTSTPTNTAGTTLSGFQDHNAWNDILNDPNFQLAYDNTHGQFVIGTTFSAGNIAYIGGNPFTLNNTAAGGGTIYVYVIAWDANYATPALAAAAADGFSPGVALGWSPVFQYNYLPGPVPGPAGTPQEFSQEVTGWNFGVVGVVPEPSTLALAAFGGAALLLFRRRQSL